MCVGGEGMSGLKGREGTCRATLIGGGDIPISEGVRERPPLTGGIERGVVKCGAGTGEKCGQMVGSAGVDS